MDNNKAAFFEILNQYFSHIYVLTIERAKERHAVIEEELKGLNYHFFWGLDSNDFSVEDLIQKNVYSEELAKKNHRYSKPIRGGMLACSLGHKMIYEDTIKNNYDKILVLEDDVMVNKFNLDNFIKAIQEFPDDGDLLYFDYHKNEKKPLLGFLKQLAYHIQASLGFLNLTHKAISNLYTKRYSKNLLIAGYHDFTNAYLITLSGAKKLLPLQTPVQWFPDHLLHYACSNKLINAYCLKEKTFLQTSQTTQKEQSLITENA
ncbi:MAG: glycosyltransferase family 25 protein [Chitinophagaceae bacterium]|nr:glycosyltransferase family 25 protein [Chitinophagaceae bacterium]MCW5904066.1 glycosyltransferase family 25 protein [Chitinophagaceae bacterium]